MLFLDYLIYTIYSLILGTEFDDILSTIKEIPLENDSKKFSDQSLRHFLFTLNCNISSDGTKYLADAIILVNENPELLKNRKLTPKYFIPLAISHFNS